MAEPVQVEGVWVRRLIAATVFAAAFSAAAETFSVGAVNCGAFHYGDADVPAADYADGWTRLAAENPADVFFYEDVGRGTDLPGDVAVPGLDIRADVRRKPLAVDVVELPRTVEVEGVPRTTPRYRALRLTYRLDGKTLAVYGVHLVADTSQKGEFMIEKYTILGGASALSAESAYGDFLRSGLIALIALAGFFFLDVLALKHRDAA